MVLLPLAVKATVVPKSTVCLVGVTEIPVATDTGTSMLLLVAEQGVVMITL